ncbi:Trdmt1 [Symbiodinium sp. CCMP2592]|nr:Trdmt1 [Symbiodinium sp. CCMP2592]
MGTQTFGNIHRTDLSPLANLEWKRLLQQAQQLSPALEGQVHNFCVQIVGEPIFENSQVKIRADVLSAPAQTGEMVSSESPQRRVLMLLRSADWPMIEAATGVVKLLQAQFRGQDNTYILDCTDMRSVIVTAHSLRHDTTLRAAEFFSGGFAGWSQAAFLLHRNGVPAHMAWTIDVDPDCSDMLAQPAWLEVSTLQDLYAAQNKPHFHVCADVTWNWWLRAFNFSPIQLACISAPCQPWSRAGSESGVASEEGMLMLRIIDILGVFRTPWVAFEQVANFPDHPHFGFIMNAWSEAGYQILWRASLDLVDVLPGHRKRFLLVLGHRLTASPKAFTVGAWNMEKRLNLGLGKVLIPLPPTLKAANTPDEATMAVYMDPYYIPSPSRPGLRPQRPIDFRLRKATDVASTFMAQYQFQHLLPPHMLEKGIMGTLVLHEGIARFFSGPEIAAIHGAVRPVFLHHDHKVQMKLLGNAIAVPHALAPLSIVCLAAGLPKAPEPAEAIRWCMASRLHNRNTVLMPLGTDWIFCHQEQTADVLANVGHRLAPDLDEQVPEAFITIQLQVPSGSIALQAPPDMEPARLFSFMGCPEVSARLPSDLSSHLQAMSVPVAYPPGLNLGGFAGSCGTKDGLCVALTAQGAFVLEHSTPRTWSQLLRLFRDIEPGPGELAIFSICGQRLLHTDQFSSCIVAAPESDDLPILSLAGIGPHVDCISVCRTTGGLRLQAQATAVLDVWMRLPFHILDAIGWESTATFAPAGQPGPLVLDMRPRADMLHMPADILLDAWRVWMFVAKLEHFSVPSTAPGAEVEVQLVALRLWTGRLPASVTLAQISTWWQAAAVSCSYPPGHRVFSGPHPKVPETMLQEMLQDPSSCVIRRSGRLLLTVHPELRGGGAKADAANWAKTKAASLCLANGVDLEATQQFVDQLAAAAGVQRLSQTLQDGPSTDRWNALLDAAKNLAAKAENRARASMQKRHKQNRMHITAAEVILSPGFFLNENGSPANVLSSIQPGVSGILLVDETDAIGLLRALHGVQPDELGLLVLGHSCPAPDECNGHLTFPATSAACGSKLLLAGCLHNIGGRRIRKQAADDIQVELPNQHCCSIDCYADELEAEAWQTILRSPVRSAVEAFRKQGAAKPALPSLADKLSFQARVATDKLDALLAASGHNHFYATPRAMDRSILNSYAIIWIGNSRAEALRASLQVPGQLGLARVKNRYGLRVPATRFADVFAQLRPGQMVPQKVTVSKMFKIGPLPPEAGATEIIAWAGRSAWNVRVIKSLGARHWLIGASTDPATEFPTFNGQAVLIEPLNKREQAQPVVQSGTRQAHGLNKPAAKNAPNLGSTEDPWLHSDPWSHAVRSTALATSFASNTSASSVPSSNSGRALAGPTESRFQQQEARLQVLEEGLEALRVRQESNHQELVQQQAVDRDRASASSSQIQEQMSMMSAAFAEQLCLSTESLQGTQRQQQQQMQSSLDELKHLMLSCRETREPSKKAKKSDEPEL